MKISINAVIFNTFASRLVGTSALYNSLAVQKGLATAESMAGSAERALSKVPFFTNVKETATKIMTISKTESEVVVEVNDDYIIGSINLAFNMYDRIADSATTMIKEMGEWDKEAKQFESKWNEDVPTDNKVDNETREVEREEVQTTSTKFEKVEVKSSNDKTKTIYVQDLDRQVVISPLTITRDGEDTPYELSVHVVRSICQVAVDPLYYDANQFDYPLDVLNAVRTMYGIPPFFSKDQVAINVAEKEDADKLARKEAKVANHPNGLKEYVENTLVDNKATENNQDN